MNIINYLLFTFPFLYRLTGSDVILPLKRIYRTVLIPIIVWLNFQSFPIAFCMALFGAILSLNLNEIEQRNWWFVYVKGLFLAEMLSMAVGLYALVLAFTWISLIYCSNNEIEFPKFLNKLDWKWAEYGIGLSITISCLLRLVIK